MKYKLSEDEFEKFCEPFISTTFKDVIQGKADKNSILFFIRKAAVMLITNEPLPDDYRVTLGHSLLKIADGEDASVIFGQKIGHRNTEDLGHKRSIALHVWTLVNIKEYPIKKAIATVAEEPYWQSTIATVKKFYYEFKDQFDSKAKIILNL